MSVEKYIKAFLARLTLWASPSAAPSVLALSLTEAFLAATLLGVLGACQTPTFRRCHTFILNGQPGRGGGEEERLAYTAAAAVLSILIRTEVLRDHKWQCDTYLRNTHVISEGRCTYPACGDPVLCCPRHAFQAVLPFGQEHAQV